MDGKALRETRKRLELTQDELAKVLGVTNTTVARWERDEMTSPPYLALALKQIELERQVITIKDESQGAVYNGIANTTKPPIPN